MTRAALILFTLLPLSAHSAPDLAAGRAFLANHCTACHAIDTTGDSPNPQSPPFRILERKYPVEDLAESMAEGLFVGHDGMPEFVLSPDQIRDVLAYLKSIQH